MDYMYVFLGLPNKYYGLYSYIKHCYQLGVGLCVAGILVQTSIDCYGILFSVTEETNLK